MFVLLTHTERGWDWVEGPFRGFRDRLKQAGHVGWAPGGDSANGAGLCRLGRRSASTREVRARGAGGGWQFARDVASVMLGDVRRLETRVWRQRLRVDTGDRYTGKDEHRSRPLGNSPVLRAGQQVRQTAGHTARGRAPLAPGHCSRERAGGASLGQKWGPQAQCPLGKPG